MTRPRILPRFVKRKPVLPSHLMYNHCVLCSSSVFCTSDIARGGRVRKFWWVLFYLLLLSAAMLRNPGTRLSVSVVWPACECPCRRQQPPAPPRLIWVQPNEMLDGLFSWGAWSKRSEVTRSNRSSRVESAWGGAGERGNVKLVRTWRNISCLLPTPSGTTGVMLRCAIMRSCS